jgi:succinoglycan biosynthesis transport protein ExoP
MNEKPAAQTDVEIDVGALLSSLTRRLPYIIVFVGVVAVATFVMLDRMAPVYKSEATVIIETGESDLTRPTQAGQTSVAPDKEAIASQIQLIRSRDVADAVAKDLDLKSRPEFDEELAPPSTFNNILATIGLGGEPTGSVDDRVLKAYFKKLQVYAVEQSRVIGIGFSSTDPKLAADAANAIADSYIAIQRAAKRSSTSSAAEFLSRQINDLRGKVVEAEGKVEAFRAQNDLFTGIGQSPMTLPEQQLAELNGELAKVRATRADSDAKAAQIRAGLKTGLAFNIPEVLTSPLIQSLVQQQVALKSTVAQLSATLLPQHPRMRELTAQVADIDRQIAGETSKILDSLDAEARLAAAREDAITKSVNDLKSAAGKAVVAGVQLSALQREASVQRDLLDQYLRSYREALAREQTDYLPADARVISRAAVPLEADFPKKGPMTAAVSVAAAILAIAVVLLSELASGRPMRRIAYAEPMPVMAPRRAAVAQVEDHRDIDVEPNVGRMAHREPTLAPALAGRIEHSLQAIASDVTAKHAKRILVAVADGSDAGGRPLAAVALARTLAHGDGRVVLVDFSGDAADARAVGEGAGQHGLADVFDGTASFADVIFRDTHSRVHFVPAGKRVLTAEEIADDRLETILSALTLTYDQVVLDAREAVIGRLAPSAAAAMVVSEFPAGDSRTERAFARIRTVSTAEIHLLVVDAQGGEGDRIERAPKATVDA